MYCRVLGQLLRSPVLQVNLHERHITGTLGDEMHWLAGKLQWIFYFKGLTLISGDEQHWWGFQTLG